MKRFIVSIFLKRLYYQRLAIVRSGILRLSLRGSHREPKQSQGGLRVISGDCHALRARNDNNPHLFSLFILLFPLILLAQNNYVFGPSIIVNDDTPGIYWHSTTQRSIGCRGDTVYLAWRDDRFGNPLWYNSRVFFSKSTGAGNTWSPNLMISQDDDTLWGFLPHLALDGSGNIYVAYTVVNDNTSNKDIFFTKSTDEGLSFSTPIIVNDSIEVAAQRNCAITVDSAGQNVYIVWEDWRNPQYHKDIYLARSTDGGLSFLSAVRVNDDDSAQQWHPVIACDNSGQNVYVAWDDRRDTLHDWDIYFSRSIDYGQTFGPNYVISDTATTGSTYQYTPSMYYKNGIIYLVWTDLRDYSDVYFAKSIDGGISFGQNVKVTDSLSESGANPSIATDDSANVYVVWQDTRDFGSYGHDIYFAFSSDSGQTFGPNVCVNDHLGIAGAWDWNPSVCVNSESTVFVAWDTDRNSPSIPDIYCAAGQLTGINEFVWNRIAVSRIDVFPTIFKNSVSIRLQLLQSDERHFEIRIYNVLGRLVKSFNKFANQSFNQISWDGQDELGFEIPGGTYFIVFELDKKLIQTKKIIKIK